MFWEAKKPQEDPSRGHWRQVRAAGAAPGPRESHSCTGLGGRLYVFGGFDGTRVLNDLYMYDINNAVWTQLVHTGISPPAR